MKSIFTNIYKFSIVFFLILVIDIYMKLNFNFFPYRYISKSLIVLTMIGYYLFNHKENSQLQFRFMLAALCFFLLGDVLLILYEYTIIYIIGIFCFILGKTFYVFRFTNQRDFKILHLLPFLLLCFLYMSLLLNLTYDSLGAFFYPVLIYLFIAMIVVLFAILRRGAVILKSYYLVLAGVMFSALSDSITILQSFYDPNLPFHEVSIMLFYGISQYLIVRGIVEETNAPLNVVNYTP